jgi:hypothetical protein
MLNHAASHAAFARSGFAKKRSTQSAGYTRCRREGYHPKTRRQEMVLRQTNGETVATRTLQLPHFARVVYQEHIGEYCCVGLRRLMGAEAGGPNWCSGSPVMLIKIAT